MNWRDKSKDSDLFFCVKEECLVITFRPGPLGRNVCPKCFTPGSIVRHKDVIIRTKEIYEVRPQGESE